MERFGKLALQIRNLNPEVTLHHMVTTLRLGPFADSLCMEPASSLDKLRRRATKFMQLEELKEARNHARAKHIPKRTKPRDSRLPPLPFPKQRDLRPSKYTQYISLNANRGQILEEALHAALIHAPRRAPTPRNADTTKPCRFHQNYGHTTDECVVLKDRIEELIQAGHLRRFVQGQGRVPRRRERTPENKHFLGGRERAQEGERPHQRQRADDNVTQEPKNPALKGVINTIAGGFTGGGCTTTTRRKHLRAVQAVNAVTSPLRRRMPPITFTDADFQGTDPAQDYPMVITVEIENFVVMKTFVDQGSSVDILYWKTFKKLQIPESNVQHYEDQIVGFSGERVSTRRYIDLYTKFGEGKTGIKKIQIRYLLVEANTSYNILLGRPSLNQLGAIVSTPHLAMKFPSPTGEVITVHMNQKTARECYAASLRIEPTI